MSTTDEKKQNLVLESAIEGLKASGTSTISPFLTEDPSDYADYSKRFLHTPPITSKRCVVAISEDSYHLIKRTLSYLNNGESSIGGFVENIVLDHLEKNRELLNAQISSHLKHSIIPEELK